MFMMRISLYFVCGYLIILLTQLAQKINLVSLESLDPISEKMEGIYKTDNFIKYIAFRASLFVFFDLNTHFQL